MLDLWQGGVCQDLIASLHTVARWQQQSCLAILACGHVLLSAQVLPVCFCRCDVSLPAEPVIHAGALASTLLSVAMLSVRPDCFTVAFLGKAFVQVRLQVVVLLAFGLSKLVPCSCRRARVSRGGHQHSSSALCHPRRAPARPTRDPLCCSKPGRCPGSDRKRGRRPGHRP